MLSRTMAHPRATKDLDVLVQTDPDNAKLVYAALVPPRRIDIINRADGISFNEAVADGPTIEIDGRAIPVIGLGALLRNKRAAGREQDAADVRALEKGGK
jgi:hypothetical protein